ncbi:MAG: Z1 domain-containing protein [bacterium]
MKKTMTNINQELFDVVYASLRNKEKIENSITLLLIQSEVKRFAALYDGADISLVTNKLQSHFTIGIGKSETLYNQKRPWISNYKQGKPNLEDFPFWNNYKRYLREVLEYPLVVVNEIDDSTDSILDGMENPGIGNSFEKKGMVIGYVQSGKTGNYVGLINKALDVGYNFIVVLAGLHNNLRQQTQFRIDQGVNGLQMINGQLSAVGVGRLPNKYSNTHTQTLTTSDINGDFRAAAANMNGINFNINTPLIAVIKKNISPLKNLNSWLDNVIGINMQERSDKAVLIIDDECDQASIDNNFKWTDLNAPIPDEDGNINNENTPSRINELINSLLNKFSRRAYVGYTATPYANVFIPIDNENYKNIFPEDFIVRLDQPSNYLGPERYFGNSENNDDLPGILEIDPEEGFTDQIKSFAKEEIDSFDIPESLKTATKVYILSGAIRFYRGQEKAHMSMLIHATHLKSVQNYLGKIFKGYWKELVHKIKQNDSVIWNDLEQIYYGEYVKGLRYNIESQEFYSYKFSGHEAFKTGNFDLPSEFKELSDFIRSFISSVNVLIINSSPENKTEKLDYHLYSKDGRKLIVIGGNTMSRGLTLEGLQTSYFIRHAGAFDTLMQMGRWFGYRTNYGDLCRIITDSDIVNDFCEICMADLVVRDNISAMIRSNASPRDFLIQVRQSNTSLAITTKMGASGQMRISWAGGEIASTLIEKNPLIIKQNHKTLITLIDKIKVKYIPQKDSNKIVFKKIPLDLFENFNSEFSLVNNNGNLNLKKIFEYYKVCKFDSVDLVILGRQKGNNAQDLNFTYCGNEIGLAQRVSKDPEKNNIFFKVRNGKLTDADYLAGFSNEKLSASDSKKPSIVCAHLDRPVITLLAMDPRYFFLERELSEGEIPNEKIVDSTKINQLGGFNQSEQIPYGISIATPSKNEDGVNLIEENVLINVTVRDNIKNY